MTVSANSFSAMLRTSTACSWNNHKLLLCTDENEWDPGTIYIWYSCQCVHVWNRVIWQFGIEVDRVCNGYGSLVQYIFKAIFGQVTLHCTAPSFTQPVEHIKTSKNETVLIPSRVPWRCSPMVMWLESMIGEHWKSSRRYRQKAFQKQKNRKTEQRENR